jgi:hypothetical protein
VSDTYQILINGTALDAEIYSVLGSVVVEEHADLPGALQLTLPIAGDGNGDITRINDANFVPYANISVVVTPDGGGPQCIFDGYVLSHKIMLDRGLTKSTLEVWGQDISCLMNLSETATEWPAGSTDITVASSIFGAHNITPSPDNANDSVGATYSDHTLMQRGSDIQFLKLLAKRMGKLCRVACGSQPGAPIGYFAKPSLDGAPVATLTMNDPQQVMVNKLEIEWDVTRPTDVDGWQALFDSTTAAEGESVDPGLTPLLSDQALSTFSPKAMKVLLATVVDNLGELSTRTVAALRDGAFFVRCTGEVQLASLRSVLRVGTVVAVSGVGAVHSGKYFVWSVQHTINQEGHTMKFELVRNAVGSPPSSAAGLLAGLSP